MQNSQPLVSVIMPVYRQKAFIGRAIHSLCKQTWQNWELIIVHDGDGEHFSPAMDGEHRIIQLVNEHNQGLGYTINRGLDTARGAYIGYLPADDIYFPEHLASLIETLQQHTGASLAYASLRHHYNREAERLDPCLQLVQVMHARTSARWTERAELESDDLHRLFWHKLDPPPTGLQDLGGKDLGGRDLGGGDLGGREGPVHSGKLTCEWVDHPQQRHKIMQEPVGGINFFRQYYQVKDPLIYHTTTGHYTDEQNRYRALREKKMTKKQGGLKILLCGELAYNAERVLALAERGHSLHGLWMRKPYWYNYIGPLPFGHVRDLDRDNWEEAIEKLQPDIIYGLLNWQAVPFVHRVVNRFPEIPFCWHFKEGPFISIEKGNWKELVELYELADGRIYCSSEMKDWFNGFLLPPKLPDLVLDGDLPKKDWFNANKSPLLSHTDGAVHTVVPGRPIGLHPQDVATLAAQNIHLHFYGEFTHGQWRAWIEKTLKLAPNHLHIHPNVAQENWVKEFSQYDAGWLHFFESSNGGELLRANWDDLNIPARMATLALAGLPMIQRNNEGHTVATQTVAREMGLGILPHSMEEMGDYLFNKELMENIRENVWNKRKHFLFDTHADVLLDYFHAVIQQAAPQKYKAPAGTLQL